jgi:flagellar hook-basal body complex protein FliE
MQTNRVDVNNLLSQMRDMKAQASGQQAIQPRSDIEAAVGTNKVQAPDFSEMFGNAINKVNDTQQHSAALAKAYEQGDPSVTLSQVMVASQKSSVAFQAVTEVRNKLIEAYKDVMSMPL